MTNRWKGSGRLSSYNLYEYRGDKGRKNENLYPQKIRKNQGSEFEGMVKVYIERG